MNTYNGYLVYRDTFYWDRYVFKRAGCIATGGCDFNDARVTHYNHYGYTGIYEATSVESIKNPLENRVWFNYPGQSSSVVSGTYELPTAIGECWTMARRS